MLRPGIKLGCDWRARPEWSRLLAGSQDLPEALKGLGITHAEFAFWRRDSTARWEPGREAELVFEAAKDLIFKGFKVYLHPYVHQDRRGPGYLGEPGDEVVTSHLEQAIDLASRLAGMQGSRGLLVFHAADAPRPESTGSGGDAGWRAELLLRSQAFFRHADAYIRRTGADVAVVCENPPPRASRIRIGESPEELLRVVEGTSFGVCLDVGHYRLCADLGLAPHLPPPELMRRVEHVHLHSARQGVDHLPAHLGARYLRRRLAELRALGKELGVTLEYDYGDGGEEDPLSVLECISQGVRTVLAA